MVKDIEILKEIEKEIGQKLKLSDIDGIISATRYDENSYAIDRKKNIIGLMLGNYKSLKFPKAASKLRNLKILDFAFKNEQKQFPKEILQLKDLEILDLRNNQIGEIPKEICELRNLRILILSGNQLKTLPKEITQLDLEIKWYDPYLYTIKDLDKSGGGIFLCGNLLESPPIEIVKKGREAVIEYFQSLEVGEKLPLNEVKVLLVGDGGAGKTCLVKRLIREDYDKNEPQTHGINIKDWQVKDRDTTINVHFWDFGGQEIMHATHQFFLSKRSLYILVLDGRKEEDAEYWLKHIESFGGNSPILVVLNKMDENPGFDINRRFLQKKYKGIKGFYRLSCANKSGIDDFSKSLGEELAKVEILETTWAKSWFNVKTQLERMTDNFISYDEYKEICKNENITEEGSQNTLVDFLNDLGVILHFKDFKLLDTHVLEPKWITQAVYKIINSEELADNKGILELGSLDGMLKKRQQTDYYYPRDRYPYIVELMKKFELCYEIDSHTVLIPDLLEVQEPKIDFDYENCLRFLIEYDFLPKSVMPRFVVRMNKDIKERLRWRTGVVLEDEDFDSTAIVKADERDRKIYIYVNGMQRRDYFSVIRHGFLSINSSFEKLQFIEKVPMPDNPSITVSYDHLTRLEKKGVDKYIPDGSDKDYKVKDLLGTIYVEKKTEEEILLLLRKIMTQTDNQETMLKKANDIMLLQPNFFGLGVNLNALIEKLLPKKNK